MTGTQAVLFLLAAIIALALLFVLAGRTGKERPPAVGTPFDPPPRKTTAPSHGNRHDGI